MCGCVGVASTDMYMMVREDVRVKMILHYCSVCVDTLECVCEGHVLEVMFWRCMFWRSCFGGHVLEVMFWRSCFGGTCFGGTCFGGDDVMYIRFLW